MIVAKTNIPVFFFHKNCILTIYGLVKYAAAFYQTILVLTGANSKEELIFFKYLIHIFAREYVLTWFEPSKKILLVKPSQNLLKFSTSG